VHLGGLVQFLVALDVVGGWKLPVGIAVVPLRANVVRLLNGLLDLGLRLARPLRALFVLCSLVPAGSAVVGARGGVDAGSVAFRQGFVETLTLRAVAGDTAATARVAARPAVVAVHLQIDALPLAQRVPVDASHSAIREGGTLPVAIAVPDVSTDIGFADPARFVVTIPGLRQATGDGESDK
jgi:hypothetical protein